MATNKNFKGKVKLAPSVEVLAYLEVSTDGGENFTVVDTISVPANETPSVHDFPNAPVIDVDDPLVQVKIRMVAQTTTTTTSSTTTTTSSTTTTTTTYNQGAVFRHASSTDAENITNANVGDFLLTGPNLTQSETSIDIRPSFNNTFSLDNCKKILIKGGDYDRISLNIPGLSGTEECPIIITNYDGQVKCKQFIIAGVAYFKLTGKYDATDQTGDPDYLGHADRYAFSSSKYGIWISNQWIDVEDFMLGIAGSTGFQATNWEVEYLEISDGGFSNVFKWDNQGQPMMDCSIHDLYIHDQHGEGVYVGSTGSGTQNPFINLHVYNNRILRVGNEGMQLGQLREGCIIEHNVIHGAVNWRSPFGEYQDNGVQFGFRNGGVEFKKNVIINGGEKWINAFTNNSGDVVSSGVIKIEDNVFLYNHGPLGAYFGQSSFLPDVSFSIRNNYFGKCFFNYSEVYTDSRAINSPHLIRIANDAYFLLENNTWDGTDGRTQFYSVVSDTNPTINAVGTVNAEVPDINFIQYMELPDGFNYVYLEQWASLVGQTWGNENQFGFGGTKKGQAITYIAGVYVTHKSKVYKAIQNSSQIEPGVTANWASYWELVNYTDSVTSDTTTTPPDDVRLVADSFYNSFSAGLLDNPTYTGTTTTSTTIYPTTTTTTTSTTTTTTTTLAVPLADKLALSVESGDNGFTLKWENLASELTTNPKFILIGSSTLAGNGASVYANSVGGLLNDQLQIVSSNTAIVANNSLSGLDTRAALPDGEDANVRENRNISMALAGKPTAIIIGFPSNDIINGLTPDQYKNNLVRIYNLARAENIATFVISVQPRTSATLSQQNLLVEAYNIIKGAIPEESFIDVFNLLRDTESPDPADINPLYNKDGIHVNDDGHEIIYNTLWSKIEAFFVDPTYTEYVIESTSVANYGDIPESWATFDTITSSTTVSKFYNRVDGLWNAYRIRAEKPDTSFTEYSEPIWFSQPVFSGSTIEQTVQIDFSIDTVAAPPADWNNLSVSSAGPALNQSFSLIENTGADSGITLSVTGAFSGAGVGGANSGIFPQRVMQDNWYLSATVNVTAQLKLSGLSNINVYDLEITSSRSATSFDRILGIDISDSTKINKTGSVASISETNIANQNNYISLKGIYSSTGEIYINIRAIGSISYLNGIVLKRRSNSSVTTTTTTITSTSSTTTTSTTSGEPNPQFLTTINSWNAYIKLPDGYDSNPSTYYPTIIFMPGLGEVGTDASKLLVAGPSKFINQGWNGSVQVDSNIIQPIIISLQPPSAYPPESSINTRIQTLKSTYRIDSNKLHLTGLSHGGWCAETFVTGDAYGGPYTYAGQIASVVAVQAVRPDDNSPYPNLFDNFANAGGRWLGFEQVNDGRDMLSIANRMNAAVENSAIYIQTNFGNGGHCCWDEFYGPSKTFANLDSRTESIYQWMLRQEKVVSTTTTTSTTTSTTTTTFVGTTTTTTSTSSTTTTSTTLTPLVAQFNFNATAQSVAGWQDVSGNPYSANPTGTQNTITVTAVGQNLKWGQQASTCSTNTGGQTTGDNSGMCPDGVLTSYWYNNGNTLTPVDDNIEISNLVPGDSYKVEIFGSRGATPTRITAYNLRDANGSELEDNFNVGNNTSVIKTFNNKVPDANGKLYLTIKMPSTGNTGNGNMFGYLNGMRVTKI